jgi:hypothetical protein
VPVTSLAAAKLGPIWPQGNPKFWEIPPNDAGSSVCAYHITFLVYANSCDGGTGMQSYHMALNVVSIKISLLPPSLQLAPAKQQQQ